MMRKLFIYYIKRISSTIRESESSRRGQQQFFIKGKIKAYKPTLRELVLPYYYYYYTTLHYYYYYTTLHYYYIILTTLY
jgi:hypothetical protein